MGASAALRYAAFADAVQALAPQTTDLRHDPHVGREDLYANPVACAAVERAILRAAGRAWY